MSTTYQAITMQVNLLQSLRRSMSSYRAHWIVSLASVFSFCRLTAEDIFESCSGKWCLVVLRVASFQAFQTLRPSSETLLQHSGKLWRCSLFLFKFPWTPLYWAVLLASASLLQTKRNTLPSSKSIEVAIGRRRQWLLSSSLSFSLISLFPSGHICLWRHT